MNPMYAMHSRLLPWYTANTANTQIPKCTPSHHHGQSTTHSPQCTPNLQSPHGKKTLPASTIDGYNASTSLIQAFYSLATCSILSFLTCQTNIGSTSTPLPVLGPDVQPMRPGHALPAFNVYLDRRAQIVR